MTYKAEEADWSRPLRESQFFGRIEKLDSWLALCSRADERNLMNFVDMLNRVARPMGTAVERPTMSAFSFSHSPFLSHQFIRIHRASFSFIRHYLFCIFEDPLSDPNFYI